MAAFAHGFVRLGDDPLCTTADARVPARYWPLEDAGGAADAVAGDVLRAQSGVPRAGNDPDGSPATHFDGASALATAGNAAFGGAGRAVVAAARVYPAAPWATAEATAYAVARGAGGSARCGWKGGWALAAPWCGGCGVPCGGAALVLGVAGVGQLVLGTCSAASEGPHHVAARVDAASGAVALFVDGALVRPCGGASGAAVWGNGGVGYISGSSAANASAWAAVAAPLCVGAACDSCGDHAYFSGYLSQVAVYDHTLADQAMLRLSTAPACATECAEGCAACSNLASKCTACNGTAACPIPCSATCNTDQLGDGVCDISCDTEACVLDNGDCYCAPLCPPEALGNDLCNPACNVYACDYDYGDCTGVVPCYDTNTCEAGSTVARINLTPLLSVIALAIIAAGVVGAVVWTIYRRHRLRRASVAVAMPATVPAVPTPIEMGQISPAYYQTPQAQQLPTFATPAYLPPVEPPPNMCTKTYVLHPPDGALVVHVPDYTAPQWGDSTTLASLVPDSAVNLEQHGLLSVRDLPAAGDPRWQQVPLSALSSLEQEKLQVVKQQVEGQR
eukprot:TRINITY_DN1248_c5_g1_i1.p1 TRINITY_DN1248_c5_g1~~TRINITY_DN1248_c5_g1_i1.p1  ORF type:complete len:581 (-),score=122.20 TRINITY_DN1248_c5_g1_i1:80-1768(-)